MEATADVVAVELPHVVAAAVGRQKQQYLFAVAMLAMVVLAVKVHKVVVEQEDLRVMGYQMVVLELTATAVAVVVEAKMLVALVHLAEVKQLIPLLQALGLLTLAAVVVAQEKMALQAAQVVQATHELLIGVNYGTTLCIY